MARYFSISVGLRGCYMPDSAYVVKVSTRRELKEVVESEARSLRDAEYVGVSKRNVASIVATAWRDTGATLPYAIPYRNMDQNYYHYGIFIGNATESEYLEYIEEVGEE